MLRRVFRDGSIYSLSNLVTRGISITLIPLYTAVLTPSDYGVIDIVGITTDLITVVLTLQITQGLGRYISDSNDITEKNRYSSTALWFTILIYLTFIIGTFIYSSYLSEILLENENYDFILKIVILSIAANGLNYFLQNQLRWNLQSKECALVTFTSSTLSIIITVYLILVKKSGVISVFYGSFWGYLIGSILAFYFTHSSFQFIFDWYKFKQMLIFSIPLTFSSVGIYVSLYIDRIAVKSLLSLHELGLYGIGYRFASVVTLLMTGFQAAIVPLIYKHYLQPDTPKDLARIFNIFIFISLALFITLSIFSKEILIFFTTPEYYSSYLIIPILIPSIMLYFMNVFSPGLSIARKTKIIALINLCTAFLNLVLNMALIPLYGILGSASATLISSFVSFALYVYWGQKFYHIPYQWAKTSISTIYSFFIVVISLYLSLFIENLFILVTIKFLLIVTTLFLLILIQLNRGEIIQLFNYITSLYNKYACLVRHKGIKGK